ncbi:MAG TPA: hypothetical protein PKA13_19165 [Geminicoccaceae bacterium]|nr:hypothetical protein [Geminicoccus sp.]HMU51904.1 hypothetical protein [Geminicoccaceae bacterium]
MTTDPASVDSSVARPETPVRYGFRAGGCAVRPEEALWFGTLLTDLTFRLQPVDRAEADLMEALAVLELKLARLDALELRVLEGDGDAEAAPLPSMATLVRYRSQLLKERAEIDRRLGRLVEARGTNEAEPDEGLDDPELKQLHAMASRVLSDSWRQPAAGTAVDPSGAAPSAERSDRPNRHERRRREAELRRAA